MKKAYFEELSSDHYKNCIKMLKYRWTNFVKLDGDYFEYIYISIFEKKKFFSLSVRGLFKRFVMYLYIKFSLFCSNFYYNLFSIFDKSVDSMSNHHFSVTDNSGMPKDPMKF